MEEQKTSTVLVVDDSPLNLSVVSELLQEYIGCTVMQALSGADTMNLLSGTIPDLVLLDVNMPGMSGYEVCAAIRADERLREIPVIFLTGQRDSAFILQGFEAGGTDYLLKPFEPRELMARVRIQLDFKIQRDELRKRNAELEAAIDRIKRLEGIIPICMYCKKIRYEGSLWQDVEQYIAENSDAYFSHGVCPECFRTECDKITDTADK